MRQFTRFLLIAGAALLLSGTVSAGEKKLMHCFYFTPMEAATDADWQAFFKATDALPGKIPGMSRVWYGKLTRPFRPAEGIERSWGVCMEFNDQAALKTYAGHEAHTAWQAHYNKVRDDSKRGTNTFDFMGQ